MDVALEEGIPRVFNPIMEFQSLFSWMLRSKLQDIQWDLLHTCFNPCSRGCCARSPNPHHTEGAEGVSILVLVDVALEGDHEKHRCRTGKFQSLFSWMLRSKEIPNGTDIMFVMFQSLFSWMLRSKWTSATSDTVVTGFNPCSRGCCARRH